MGQKPTFGWGKHRVRLYAVRTRRGTAPAPPAPKGEKKCSAERGMPHRICAAVNKKEAYQPKTICVKKYRYERLRIAPLSTKRRAVSPSEKIYV